MAGTVVDHEGKGVALRVLGLAHGTCKIHRTGWLLVLLLAEELS